MIRFLARHEWRVLTASAVVQWTLAIFAVALLAASALGASRAAREQAMFDAFSRRTVQQLAQSSPARADLIANEKGWLAVVPPAPLGLLAVGQADVHPGYLKVTARSVDALVTGDQIEHPLAVASGHFDAAFVVLFLYPLLIFALSFDLTATERDRGTLRMVLAQPVRLGDVVAGKMIARALALAIPVVLIPLLFVIATAGATAEAVALQTALWTIAVLAYGSIWHGIALWINARGWSAAANALVLAGIWLIFAIVGPSTINLVIDVVYPMPSRVEAAVEARAATNDAAVQGSRQLGQFLQDHPTSANVGVEGMRQFARLQAARDQQVADRLRAVEDAFDAQLRRQRALVSWLSISSPTMIAQGVLLESAGTGASRFEHFRDQARAFQRQWRAHFEPKVLDAATLDAAEISGAPRFEYAGEPIAATVRRTVVPIAGMAAAGALLLVIGFRSYRGYSL